MVSRLADSGGHYVGEPVDIVLQADLMQDSMQKEVLRTLDEYDPLLVTVAFPCDPWSQLQQLNIAQGRGALVEQRRREQYTFLVFTRAVLMSQLRRGRMTVAENMWWSATWAVDPLRRCIGRGLHFGARRPVHV